MNYIKIFLKIFVVVILLASCQKEVDTFTPNIGQIMYPDTTWATAIGSTSNVSVLKNKLLLDISIDSFELASTPVVLNASSGLRCSFTPGSLINSNGEAVSGKIVAETFLLKKRGDFIRMDAPTTSNDSLLVSTGEFYISLKQNSNQLKVAPGAKITVRYNEIPLSFQTQVFNGEPNTLLGINWVPNTDIPNNWILAGPDYYEITQNKLGWINCGYYYTSANLTTSISTVLPPHYTNTNTLVYLVFNESKSVINMKGNASSKKFMASNIPINRQATLVVISHQANDYYFSKLQTLTALPSTAGGSQKITINPVKTSLDNIKSALSNL